MVPGAHAAVHGAPNGCLPGRAAQDLHRQDPEVRASEPRRGDGARPQGRH